MPITAQNAALAAQRWKEEHPDAYRLLAETCLDLRRRNVRCSMRYAIEKVRVMDYPSAHRRPEIPFKTTLCCALARMLIRYPERARSERWNHSRWRGVGMARTKTCIGSDVVRSDAFLSLSHEAQALYFQLNLEADGYGVVTSAAMLMRGCGFDPQPFRLEESQGSSSR